MSVAQGARFPRLLHRAAVDVCGLALVVLLAGCEVLLPEPTAAIEILEWEQFYYTLEADFEVMDWEQDRYSSLGRYGLVDISYKVTNTGWFDIRYYEVWFEVETEDGMHYREWTNGLNVPRWGFETDSTLINTGGKRAVSVSVVDYELKPPYGEEPHSFVKIDFQITNTGLVDIESCKVWFQVKSSTGITFEDYTYVLGLPAGRTETDMAFVDTYVFSEAVSVSFLRYEVVR